MLPATTHVYRQLAIVEHEGAPLPQLHLCPSQPDDENFTLAHDFCLQKEYYHSFCDVNPSTVESFYAE